MISYRQQALDMADFLIAQAQQQESVAAQIFANSMATFVEAVVKRGGTTFADIDQLEKVYSSIIEAQNESCKCTVLAAKVRLNNAAVNDAERLAEALNLDLPAILKNQAS